MVRNVASNYPLPARIAKLMSFFVTGNEFMSEIFLSHCESGVMIAERLGFRKNVQEAVRYLWERWDGRSQAYHLSGTDTPIAARVLHLAQVMEVGHRFGGVEFAIRLADERNRKDFDPAVVDAFRATRDTPGFWSALEAPSAKEMVLELRPATGHETVTDADVETVCEVLADFIDIKTR